MGSNLRQHSKRAMVSILPRPLPNDQRNEGACCRAWRHVPVWVISGHGQEVAVGLRKSTRVGGHPRQRKTRILVPGLCGSCASYHRGLAATRQKSRWPLPFQAVREQLDQAPLGVCKAAPMGSCSAECQGGHMVSVLYWAREDNRRHASSGRVAGWPLLIFYLRRNESETPMELCRRTCLDEHTQTRTTGHLV